MATDPVVVWFTYQQARARFANTCVRTKSRERILEFLNALSDEPIPFDAPLTDLQLAYKLAWKILPAGPIAYVK